MTMKIVLMLVFILVSEGISLQERDTKEQTRKQASHKQKQKQKQQQGLKQELEQDSVTGHPTPVKHSWTYTKEFKAVLGKVNLISEEKP